MAIKKVPGLTGKPVKGVFSKEEVNYFLRGGRYIIFITLPVKFIDNKKLLSLYKKFAELNFVICFCHKAKRNSFFHTVTLSGNVEELLIDISKKELPRIKELMRCINGVTGYYLKAKTAV